MALNLIYIPLKLFIFLLGYNEYRFILMLFIASFTSIFFHVYENKDYSFLCSFILGFLLTIVNVLVITPLLTDITLTSLDFFAKLGFILGYHIALLFLQEIPTGSMDKDYINKAKGYNLARDLDTMLNHDTMPAIDYSSNQRLGESLRAACEHRAKFKAPRDSGNRIITLTDLRIMPKSPEYERIRDLIQDFPFKDREKNTHTAMLNNGSKVAIFTSIRHDGYKGSYCNGTNLIDHIRKHR